MMPKPMQNPRAAIFAHNGRSDAPSAAARFDRLSVGISFHNSPVGPADLNSFKGWRLQANAGERSLRATRWRVSRARLYSDRNTAKLRFS